MVVVVVEVVVVVVVVAMNQKLAYLIRDDKKKMVNQLRNSVKFLRSVVHELHSNIAKSSSCTPVIVSVDKR